MNLEEALALKEQAEADVARADAFFEERAERTKTELKAATSEEEVDAVFRARNLWTSLRDRTPYDFWVVTQNGRDFSVLYHCIDHDEYEYPTETVDSREEWESQNEWWLERTLEPEDD